LGEKGSGKTLLAKNIAIELGKAGLPTILINEPHFGDEFNTFISSIDQPCVVFFDEFEKVYDNDDENSEQDRMLSLLDGVFTSKKLFLLTANDQFKISKYIINRPGRVFYTFKYAGLTDEFIREFCDEKLNEKSHIEDILKFTMCVSAFNFDALNAVVEELNRYGGDFASVIDYLNLETDLAGTSFYEVELYQDGQRVPDHAMYEPLMRLRLTDRHDSNIRIDMREGYKDSFFTERDLIAMDYTTKTYTYENSKKEKVILKKLGSFRGVLNTTRSLGYWLTNFYVLVIILFLMEITQ
jgi:hypothetical protein